MRNAALRASLALGPRALEHANSHLSLSHAERAVDALLGCSGRRWFTGVGKSGLAAARMASSLTSIGLPAHWVHGTEWFHGELGGVGSIDVITAVSHSGTTTELLALADMLEAHAPDALLITLTGDACSPLAARAHVPLTAAVPAGSEAVHDLLPAASVLAAHHVFNALLAECAARRELTLRDVRRHHPRGHVAARAAAEQNSQ